MAVTTIVSPEEAAKVSEEKTKKELEKLQKDIQKNGFQNPSDIDDSDSDSQTDTDSDSDSDYTYESESESDVEYVKKTKKKKKKQPSMDTRMYNDNQNLWKKIQKLEGSLKKTEKELRYMKYEHNNKCIEITDLQNKNLKLKEDIKAQLAQKKETDGKVSRLNEYRRRDALSLMFCYFYMLLMLINYKFEVPIFDMTFKTVRNVARILFTTDDKMLLNNNDDSLDDY